MEIYSWAPDRDCVFCWLDCAVTQNLALCRTEISVKENFAENCHFDIAQICVWDGFLAEMFEAAVHCVAYKTANHYVWACFPGEQKQNAVQRSLLKKKKFQPVAQTCIRSAI